MSERITEAEQEAEYARDHAEWQAAWGRVKALVAAAVEGPRYRHRADILKRLYSLDTESFPTSQHFRTVVRKEFDVTSLRLMKIELDFLRGLLLQLAKENRIP